jgi:hypothetical protein
LDDTDKVTIHDLTDPGSTPEKPLAFVSMMSDFVGRSSGERASAAAESDTDSEDVRYLYYLLYDVHGDPIPPKVAIGLEKPFVGRIRADYITPPHSLSSLKLYLSRVERNPTLAYYAVNFFDELENPLGEISNLRTDGPGLSPDEPMAIVLTTPIPGPDGKYIIKNRAADIYWSAGSLNNPIKTVYFYSGSTTTEAAKKYNWCQWNIKHDTDGHISMTSPYAPSSWAGADLTGSTVPLPWRLIPADGKSYYLTTEINLDSQNPRVPEAKGEGFAYGTMATLKEGDQWQMWEFIPVNV